MSSHAVHEGEGVLLFEDCPRCGYLALNPQELDTDSLKTLGQLAEMLRKTRDNGAPKPYMSSADQLAVSSLRMFARTTFASEISYEAAR